MNARVTRTKIAAAACGVGLALTGFLVLAGSGSALADPVSGQQLDLLVDGDQGRCLQGYADTGDVTPTACADGDDVVGVDAKNWTFVAPDFLTPNGSTPYPANAFRMVNTQSGLCLDIDDANPYPTPLTLGAYHRVDLKPCAAVPSQLWLFIEQPVDPGTGLTRTFFLNVGVDQALGSHYGDIGSSAAGPYLVTEPSDPSNLEERWTTQAAF
jgi:hypothetical protein